MPNKELAQAIQKATGLSTDSSDDTIYFPGKTIEWEKGDGPALKAEILPILKRYAGKDTEFTFEDYEEGEPDERDPRDAKVSITLPN